MQSKKRRLEELHNNFETYNNLDTESKMSEENKNDIDINLYSRQIGAFGFETMKKLKKLNVFISGMKGLGAEIAKNLILAGPGSVCIHDDNIVQKIDLGSNFCLSENDIGLRSLSEASMRFLSTLNPYVNVSYHKGNFDMEFLENFDVIVMNGKSRKELLHYGKIVRHNKKQSPIGFIAADCLGLTGYIFVDFGDDFISYDAKGEEPKSAIVTSIQKEEEGVIILDNEKPIIFETGDYVKFKEVKGMTEINGMAPVKIEVIGRHSFKIPIDTREFSQYQGNGIVTEVKMPVKFSFKSYEDSCMEPIAPGENCLIQCDFSKLNRPEQLHTIIQSLLIYKDKLGEAIDSESVSDIAENIYKIAIDLNKKNEGSKSREAIILDKVDFDLVNSVVRYHTAHVNFLAAFFGGIVAQEIVKFTGKYTPLRQWFYYDAFELIPSSQDFNFSKCGTRYDDYISIWGKEFQEKLMNLKIFVVGVGALGCEYLKNFSLVGIASGASGKITLTDMDRIEVSNLNRQFLFRRDQVGYPKSTVAAHAIKEMNKDTKLHALEYRVGKETENVFNDDFWNGLDLVVNALDNILSRQYVDSKCVWHLKPLVESGTLGTKGNVQVILPHMTQSYNDSRDPAEESFPLCTLKHFPYSIEHCIQWGRDLFEDLFTNKLEALHNFIENPSEFMEKTRGEKSLSIQKDTLDNLLQLVKRFVYWGVNFRNCVDVSLEIFHDCFINRISQLLFTFPLDHLDSSGLPFWGGMKRPPKPLDFNFEDPTILSFILSAANLFARALNIDPCYSKELVIEVSSKKEYKSFGLKKFKIVDQQLPQNDEVEDEDGFNFKSIEKELYSYLSQLKNVNVTPIFFDKDEETNLHVNFVTASTNLRARNYNIGETDSYKVKLIAGKIIPAISTTTCAISALIVIEVIKAVLYKVRKLEDFKNAFINLALPLWVFSEPLPPIRAKDTEYDIIACGPLKARPSGFTPWDRLEVKIADCTVRQLCDYLEEHYKVIVNILSSGVACFYNSYIAAHRKNRDNEKISTLIETITKQKLMESRNYVIVEASCVDADDSVDIIIPPIQLIYK